MLNQEIGKIVEDEYHEMWNNWIIFQKFDLTSDTVQVKKLIGMVDEKAEFNVRPSIMHPPNL